MRTPARIVRAIKDIDKDLKILLQKPRPGVAGICACGHVQKVHTAVSKVKRKIVRHAMGYGECSISYCRCGRYEFAKWEDDV